MGLWGTLRGWALVALFGCVTCANPRPPAAVPATYYGTPLVVRYFHADRSFTPHERALLADAALGLYIQTSGYFDVRLEYDLDPNLLDMPGWSLLRAQASAPWIMWADLTVGGDLLGLTNTTQQRVFLVIDRLAIKPAPDTWFVHVAMHEFLHAAGVDHAATGSIMPAYAAPGTTPKTCLNSVDAMQFCDAVACEWQSLNYCGKPGKDEAIGLLFSRPID